jgi:hypothetical protein
VLSCEECGAESEVDEREPGWRAYIVAVPDPDSEDVPPRVLVYCPRCALEHVAGSL